VWEDVVLMLSLCPWGFSVFGDSRCAMPLGTCAFRACVCVSWKLCGGCGIICILWLRVIVRGLWVNDTEVYDNNHFS